LFEVEDHLSVLNVYYRTLLFHPLPWIRWRRIDDKQRKKKPDGRKGRKLKQGYITVTIRVRRRVPKKQSSRR